MTELIAWVVSNALALGVGAVLMLVSTKFASWITKQFNDIKSHMP